MRHNQIRDLTANLLEEAGCKDVTTEPRLLPITGEEFDHKTTITANDARLDVAALGVWNPLEKCFLDIRIFNSRAPTKSIYTPTDVRTYVRTDCVGTHQRTYGLLTVKTENVSYQSESHCIQLISIRSIT